MTIERIRGLIGNLLSTQSERLAIVEDPSEDKEFLFNNLPRLVREGRRPLRIDTINDPDNPGEMLPYYQVPPSVHRKDLVRSIYPTAGGIFVFEYYDGTKRTGSTYTLTNQEAEGLEQKVTEELERQKEAGINDTTLRKFARWSRGEDDDLNEMRKSRFGMHTGRW